MASLGTKAVPLMLRAASTARGLPGWTPAFEGIVTAERDGYFLQPATCTEELQND